MRDPIFDLHDPGGIRTHNLCLRQNIALSIELQGHGVKLEILIFKMWNFLRPVDKLSSIF